MARLFLRLLCNFKKYAFRRQLVLKSRNHLSLLQPQVRGLFSARGGKGRSKMSMDSEGLLSRGLYIYVAIFLNKVLPNVFFSFICKCKF